jgi:YidC/Oxa1 family membrane protein insertase
LKPEQRSLLAIVLSVLVLIGWFFFFAPKQASQERPAPQEKNLEDKKAQPSVEEFSRENEPREDSLSQENESRRRDPEKLYTLSTPLFEVRVSNQGGQIRSLELNGFYEGVDEKAPRINLLGQNDQALNLVCRRCTFQYPHDAPYQLVSESEQSLTLRWMSPETIITRRYQVDDTRYLIDQEVTIENRTGEGQEIQVGMAWSVMNTQQEGSFLSNLSGPADVSSLVYQMSGRVERIAQEKDDQEGLEKGALSWTGIESRYFLKAFISRQLSGQELMRYQFKGDRVSHAFYYPPMRLGAKEKKSLSFSVFTGPKEINMLKKIGVGLDEAIDYGWFGILAVPILYCLKIFESFFHSWGLAIILLTFLVKILLNPLSIKGMKSMKAMQKLQPKLKEMREKFGDDKQRLNQETMALFRTHKVNPMGGCLPMLIQMPLYLALYKVLYNSIELFHAPFLFYSDLAAPDPYYVSPILLGIFMVLQQKLTPSASADPTQQKMMMLMPIMFTGFMIFLPMGLVLYILVNTVMTVVQNFMFQKDIRWRDVMRGRIRLS